MAIGDVVTSLGDVNTLFNFQPAAGVEVMITTLLLDQGVQAPSITDGTLESYILTSFGNFNYTNGKIFLTNTNYLTIPAQGGTLSNGCTGIQIK